MVRSLAVLPCLSLKALVGPAREQQLDGARVVELGGDHQRGAAAIVRIVDMRAAIEQQFHDLDLVLTPASSE